jgi:predicted short-subunit dehydrogenase-like oxidoreductase (DUF2520 family)
MALHRLKPITLGFIGTGKVGCSLALKLSEKGYPVVAVYDKNQTSARNLAKSIKGCHAVGSSQDVANSAGFIFVTTTDAEIASVIAEVKWHEEQSVVHCSGADSVAILEPAKKCGAQVGIFHPLQTFPNVEQAVKNMAGSTFTLEAEQLLLDKLKDMVTALGGHWMELRENGRIAYHAAAVIVSNYLITLIKLATDLWQTFDIPPEQVIQALLPLIRGTIDSLDTVGIPQCLTGPIARGDAHIIERHLKALEESAPNLIAIYRELGLQTIPLALAKGNISQHQAKELNSILRGNTKGKT